MDKIEKKGPVRILKEHLMSNSNQYWSIIVCTKFLGKKILHVNFLQQPHSMMVSEEIYLINIESYDNSKKKKKKLLTVLSKIFHYHTPLYIWWKYN